jgi:glucose-6-phosphate isomerase
MSVINQKFILDQEIESKESDIVEEARKKIFSEAENIPLLLSNETEEEIENIQNIAQTIKKNFTNLLILGTGASESIPKIFFALGDTELNVEFLSNVDQYCVDRVLKKMQPQNTCVIAISKSGNTVEIITLLMYMQEWFRKEITDSNLSSHFYFITEFKESPIYLIAKKLGATLIEHDNIGGRYSTFTSVGLLPAAIAGFDINKVINHAKHYFRDLIKPDSWVMSGVSYNNSMSKKFTNNVFMSYGDRFEGINLWVRQLIAESLGKDSKGITPITSRGIVDHHSQLQLYLDGPNDKFFTIISSKKNKSSTSFSINRDLGKEYGVDYLSGATLNDVMDAQMDLSIVELKEHNKNIRILETERMDEEFVAEFVMGTMLEVILFAYINDINPFGQPAVENIKKNFTSYIKVKNAI